MRVLVVRPGPHFSVSDVHRGWVKGLKQNGCEVVEFDLDRRLDFYDIVHVKNETGGFEKALDFMEVVRLASKGIEVACYEWWPDVVLVTSGFFVPPEMYELLRARGHKVVALFTESPYEDSKQIERAPLFDVVVINDPTNLEKFRAVNPNTYYIPHAYDPDIHFPGPAKPNCVSDFCFVGTGYPSRVGFLEQIDWSGVDVALAGNWQNLEPDSPLFKFLSHPIEFCCDNTEAVDLYRGTKMSANLYRRETIGGASSDGWAMGPREVELAACGTFYITEPRGENREVLPMVPDFRDADEFQDMLATYLKYDDVREYTARKAREAIADRTFVNHAAQLLRHLERI